MDFNQHLLQNLLEPVARVDNERETDEGVGLGILCYSCLRFDVPSGGRL